MTRSEVLAEAVVLVGERGSVRDYQCDCDPGGERFIVDWAGDPVSTCYNIEELRRKCAT